MNLYKYSGSKFRKDRSYDLSYVCPHVPVEPDYEAATNRCRSIFGPDVALANHDEEMTDEDWKLVTAMIVDAGIGEDSTP